MLFEFDMPEKIYNAVQDDVNIATLPPEDLAVLQKHLYEGKVLAEGSIEEICKLTGCADLEKSYFTLIENDGGSDE